MNVAHELLPREGALAFSLFIKGQSGRVETVYLAPGSGISRRSRRIAESGSWIFLIVRGEGELGSSPSPDAFDDVTLKWMARVARSVVIWSAAGIERADEVARQSALQRSAGCRRFLTVEAPPLRVPEWRAFLSRWVTPGVPVMEIGPLSEGGE